MLFFAPGAGAMSDRGALKGLDPGSRECIGCHSSKVRVDETGLVCHKGDCGHIIGVDYAAAASERGDIAGPSALPAAIRFFDGKMGCGTCHIQYTPGEHASRSTKDLMLVMDNAGSRLCLACHLK